MTSNGTPLRRLLPERGAAVLLVYDPADVFACGSSMAEWLSWGRRNPGRLVLAFSRVPSRAEAKQLLMDRVGAALVLERPARVAAPVRSAEFLIVDGKVAGTQVVSRRVLRSPLLQFALAHPDAGSVAVAYRVQGHSGPLPDPTHRSSPTAEEER